VRIVEVKNGITLIPELSLPGIPAKNQDMIKKIEGMTPIREISIVVTRQFLKRRIIDRLQYAIQDSIPKDIWTEKRGEIVDTNVKI
jgi:LysR family hydrogen peroxide-inducible transcriptional activator